MINYMLAAGVDPLGAVTTSRGECLGGQPGAAWLLGRRGALSVALGLVIGVELGRRCK